MPKKKKNPELKDFIIIGKFSDGKCRQILVKSENMKTIINFIGFIEVGLRVNEKVIEGIDIESNGE